MDTPKVWYVTGASRGLGLTLVKGLLENGYRVAATSRDAHTLARAVGLIDKDRFLPLAVDLNNLDCIDESIQQTLATFGRIDVVVNNAGYGMAGTIEETTEQDIGNIFNVNVLATIDVVKSVLPVMRSQRSGYIINIGSVAGFVGAPGWAVYSSTKAAVAAFSEVIALDVKEFGIKVTVVEPSGFPTCNPHRAAKILMELAENPEPPMHLFLGNDAYNRASKKLTDMSEELELWKSITAGADLK